MQLDVLSVGTIASVLRELVPRFMLETGVDVTVFYANPADTSDRVRDGAKADLAIVADGVWEGFAALPRVDPASKVALCRTAFRAAQPPSATRADIGSLDALRDALLRIDTLALVARSASQRTLQAGFVAMGIANELAGKTRLLPTGEAVAEALAHGNADFGITTYSELLSVDDLVLLDPLPPAVTPADTVSIASVLHDAAAPDVARRFLAYLQSPPSRAIFAAKGHGDV